VALEGTHSPSDGPNPLRDTLHELVHRWKALVGIPLTAGVIAVVGSFLVPNEYEGVAIFSPAEDVSSSLPGNLASIAAQFGVNAPTAGYNVYYFAQVSRSRETLRLVALDTIEVGGERLAVLDLMRVGPGSAEERVDRAIVELTDVIRVRTDDQAELVTLRARARTPALATALVISALDALNAVTTASIQRSGSAERRFAMAQADSARQALREAEDGLRDFYLANRSIAASPTLQAEEARLRRQIQIRQDLYITLVNQAEAAKLREIKNTPAIAVVQPPQASSNKVRPRRAVWAASAIIGAFLCALAWLYAIRPLLPSTDIRAPSGA